MLRLKTLDRLPFNWRFAMVWIGIIAFWVGVIWWVRA